VAAALQLAGQVGHVLVDGAGSAPRERRHQSYVQVSCHAHVLDTPRPHRTTTLAWVAVRSPGLKVLVRYFLAEALGLAGVPAMKASVFCRASSSLYWMGGDFMK
jgi:hypothetical protein